jgi:hypothetical protein
MAHQGLVDPQVRTVPRGHKAHKVRQALKALLALQGCPLYQPDVVMQWLDQLVLPPHHQYTDHLVLLADPDPPDHLEHKEDREVVVE